MRRAEMSSRHKKKKKNLTSYDETAQQQPNNAFMSLLCYIPRRSFSTTRSLFAYVWPVVCNANEGNGRSHPVRLLVDEEEKEEKEYKLGENFEYYKKAD